MQNSDKELQGQIDLLRNEVEFLSKEIHSIKKNLPIAGNAVAIDFHNGSSGSKMCYICKKETYLWNLVWLDCFDVACQSCYTEQNKS